MKRIYTFIAIIALSIMCGCKSIDGKCSDGPVEPDKQSYEHGQKDDPRIPFMIPWWKFM